MQESPLWVQFLHGKRPPLSFTPLPCGKPHSSTPPLPYPLCLPHRMQRSLIHRSFHHFRIFFNSLSLPSLHPPPPPTDSSTVTFALRAMHASLLSNCPSLRFPATVLFWPAPARPLHTRRAHRTHRQAESRSCVSPFRFAQDCDTAGDNNDHCVIKTFVPANSAKADHEMHSVSNAWRLIFL